MYFVVLVDGKPYHEQSPHAPDLYFSLEAAEETVENLSGGSADKIGVRVALVNEGHPKEDPLILPPVWGCPNCRRPGHDVADQMLELLGIQDSVDIIEHYKAPIYSHGYFQDDGSFEADGHNVEWDASAFTCYECAGCNTNFQQPIRLDLEAKVGIAPVTEL